MLFANSIWNICGQFMNSEGHVMEQKTLPREVFETVVFKEIN